MDDIFKLFNALAKGPPPQLRRDDVGDGITVSTVNSADQGFETAICDMWGAHPVERYATRMEALAGHERWVEKAPTLTEITRLGYGELVEEEQVILERESD